VLQELEQDLGQYGYAGQIGQKPTPPGGGMFKIENLNVVDSLPANITNTVRYWDKAGSTNGGAFTVGIKMAITQSGKLIVLDIKRGQWAAEVREKIIRQTAEADGSVVKIYIEQEPGSGGKESAEATIRNLMGYSCYADRPVGDKAFRADPFSVQVNNGQVLLLRGDWNKGYTDELQYFPFSTYKDQVDASSGAFSKLVMKKQVKILR
jgi:predicted phage terminase large subunit-like protein